MKSDCQQEHSWHEADILTKEVERLLVELAALHGRQINLPDNLIMAAKHVRRAMDGMYAAKGFKS